MDVVLEQEGRGIVIDWNNEEDTLRQVLAQPYSCLQPAAGRPPAETSPGVDRLDATEILCKT